MDDTMFADQYLLRKGATVMTVTPVQHTEASLWGPNVNNFDHRRFLREPDGGRPSPGYDPYEPGYNTPRRQPARPPPASYQPYEGEGDDLGWEHGEEEQAMHR